MDTKIEDYVDVDERLVQLGCKEASGITLLPTNFKSASKIEEFRQEAEAATVKTLFREAGIPLTEIVDREQRPKYIQNNFAEWVGPTLLISSALWSQNQYAVTLALNIISNYLTDLFRGTKANNVKLNFVIRTTKSQTYKHISYEGNVAGIANLEKLLRDVANEK
jgi:preprotein translocase subunit SecF